MSRYNLAELQQRFADQIAQVDADVMAAQASGDRRRMIVAGERSLVYLQDCYSRFIRDLVLRSSLGNATTASGVRLPAGGQGVMRESAALTYLRRNWPARTTNRRRGRAVPAVQPKPGWWEPDWYLNNDWTITLRLLAPANSRTIAGALGSSASPGNDLRFVRNFAVHRGPASADRIAQVATRHRVSAWRQPCDIVTVPVGGTMLFAQWSAQLRAVSQAAVR